MTSTDCDLDDLKEALKNARMPDGFAHARDDNEDDDDAPRDDDGIRLTREGLSPPVLSVLAMPSLDPISISNCSFTPTRGMHLLTLA